MKTPLLLATIAVAALAIQAPAADASFGEGERQAFAAATQGDVLASLKELALPAETRFSVLAVKGDRDDAIAGYLKIAVTASGKTYVEGREDPMWDAVVKELGWDEQKAEAGLLDAKTIAKIGSLQATDVLIYGSVRACEKSENRVFVELELHATEVKTKKHVWGGLFAKRWYVPGTDVPKGISELPLAVRSQLKSSATAKMVESLNAQPKLGDIKSVVLLPLAGDEDRYCTYIARDAIVKTALTAKELDLATLKGARVVFRDLPVAAGDAVIYGAVRQLAYYEQAGFWNLYTICQAVGQVNGAFLLATERTKAQAIFTVIGQVFTLALVFVLQVPNFLFPQGLGASGMAWNYLVCNFVLNLVILTYIARGLKMNALSANCIQILPLCICTVSSYLLYFLVNHIGGEGIIMNCVRVFIGGVMYSVIIGGVLYAWPSLIGMTKESLRAKLGGILNRFRRTKG